MIGNQYFLLYTQRSRDCLLQSESCCQSLLSYPSFSQTPLTPATGPLSSLTASTLTLTNVTNPSVCLTKGSARYFRFMLFLLKLMIFLSLQFSFFHFWILSTHVEFTTDLIAKRQPICGSIDSITFLQTEKREGQPLQQEQSRKEQDTGQLSSTISPCTSIPRLNTTYVVGPKRIAVVIAGTLHRFQLNSSIQHLLKPLRIQQHSVDYYISLTTEPGKSFLDLEYMDKIHFDPIFSNGTILTQLPSNKDLKLVINRSITDGGGKLRHLVLRDSVDSLLMREEQLKARREQAIEKYPNEHPDTRFPMFDVRSDAIIARTIRGNTNILRLMFLHQELWQALTETEVSCKKLYDYVMFLRDDTSWLDDFNFNALFRTVAPTVEVIGLSCDAREYPMHPSEINDHGLIMTRKRARIIGNYYSEIFKMDYKKCMAQLDLKTSNNRKRGCNSEMMLKWILEQEHQVKVQLVSQQQLPFQRMIHVILPNGLVGKCFHKYCQSRIEPLEDHGFFRCKHFVYGKELNNA